MVQTYQPYWVETLTKLWTKLSFAGAGTYDVFVKLASGQTPSFDNVFIWGDTFSDVTLDNSKWEYNRLSGTGPYSATITDGIIAISADSNTSAGLISKTGFEFPFVVESKHRATATSSNYLHVITQTVSGDNDNRVGYKNLAGAWNVHKRVSGTETAYESGSRAIPTSFVNETAKFTASSQEFFEDDVALNTVTTQDRYSTGTNYIQYMTYQSTNYYDFIAVRQYAASEPTIDSIDVVGTNTLKFTITTTGALTDYQIGLDVSSLAISSVSESIQVYFDETPPVITYEASQLYTSNENLEQVAEIIDESNLSSVTIQRNSDTPITMTKVSGSLNVYGATVPISAGYNYLTVYAEDEWGNSASSSTKTVIGISAADDRPVVTLVGSYPSTTTESTLLITATVVSDDFQYAKIHNSKVAGTVDMTATGNPNEYSGTVSLNYGDNIIYVEAMGGIGWYGYSSTIVITLIDTETPTVVRGITTRANLYYKLDEFVAPNSTTAQYTLSEKPIPVPLVRINGELIPHTGYTVDYNDNKIIFTTAPTQYSEIDVVYLYGEITILPNTYIKILRTNGDLIGTVISNSYGIYETTIYGAGIRDIQINIEDELNAKIEVELGG